MFNYSFCYSKHYCRAFCVLASDELGIFVLIHLHILEIDIVLHPYFTHVPNPVFSPKIKI